MQSNQLQVENDICNNVGTRENHKCNYLVHKKDSSSWITSSDTKSMDVCISTKCKSGCALDQDIASSVNQLVNNGHTSPLNHDASNFGPSSSSPALLIIPTSATTGSQPDEVVASRDRFVPLKITHSIKEQTRAMASMKAEESLRYERELRSCTKIQAWWKATLTAPVRLGHASARNRADKFSRMQEQSSMTQGDLLMSEATTREVNQRIEKIQQKKHKEGFFRHAEDNFFVPCCRNFEIMQGIELQQQLKMANFKSIKRENIERKAMAVEYELSKVMRDAKPRELLENHCMTYEERCCKAKALLEFKNRHHEQEAKEEAAMMKEDVASNEWNTILNEREKLLTPLQRLCNRDQMDLCATFLTRCNEQSKLTSVKTTISMHFFKDTKYYQIQPPAHLLYFPFLSASVDVKLHDQQQQRMLVNHPSITSNVSLCQLSSSRAATSKIEIERDQSDLDGDGDDISNKPLTMALMSHLGPLNKLKELDLSVEGLTEVSLLRESGASSLLSLSLNVNRLRSLRGVGSLTGLRRLYACDNCLSNLRGLECLSQLQELNVDVNQIKSLESLGELFCLTELSVATNKISALPEHPLTLYNLQKFNLFHNRVASIPQRSLSQLRHLTDLDIGRNILTKISGEVFDGCVALIRLVLSHNRLKTPPNNMRLPLLKELWLNGNCMNSLQDWTGIWLPSLQELRLEDNRLTSLGNRLLTPRLYSSDYVDGGGVGFTGLSGMPLLQILNVSFNILENDHSLDGLYCCRRLQELHIHDNPISNVDSPLYRTMFRQVLNFCPSLQVLNGDQIVEGEAWLSDAWKIARKSNIIIPPLLRLMNGAGVTVRECRGAEADSLLTALASKDTSKTLTCNSCGKTAQGLLPEEGVTWEWAPNDRTTEVGIRESRKKRLIINCEACGAKGYTLYRPFVFDWNAMVRWSKAYHVQRSLYSINEFDIAAGHKLDGHGGTGFEFNAWFEAECLQGNLSWATLRGRQRREERALAADAWGRGMGGGDQDLCIRRLDLMDQHTRESKEHTKHQLCKLLLLRPCSEEAAAPRQVDRHFPASEKDAAACASSPQAYEADDCTNVKCSKISYHLCDRTDESSCAFHVKEEDDVTTNNSESNKEKLVAARVVQSVFRGFHTRRSLNAALSSAQYLDDEIQKIQDFGPIDVDAVLGPLQPNLKVSYDGSSIVSKSNTYSQTMGKAKVVHQNIGASHTTTTEMSASIPGRYEANITPPPTQSLTVTRQQDKEKKHSAAAAAAAEWGLTNPNTIRSMLARRRRLQRITRQDKQKN